MKRYRLQAMAAAMVAATSLAHAETTLEDRLAAAEQRLSALESSGSDEHNITINGFMTFAMERASAEDAAGNDLTYSGGVENQDWNLNRLTRAGLQINGQISDKANAVVQLLGRADSDFDAEVQWAYVSYDLTPTLEARAGRIVLPFYMHSQYTQVGYAYPWVELPQEMYSVVPLDTMEGIDLTWTFNTGSISHSLNAFWGGMDVDDGSTVYEVRNQYGFDIRSTWNNWTGWYSFSNAEVSVDLSGAIGTPALNLDHHYAYFTGLGLQYDNGSLIVMGERGRLSLSSPNHWFPKQDSAYIMAGYRIGKFTPHLTWASIEHSDAGDVDPFIVPGPVDLAFVLFADTASQQKSWTLGTRYDLTPGVSLKAEASSYYGFTSDNPVNTGLFSGTPDEDKNAYVYRFAVETVF